MKDGRFCSTDCMKFPASPESTVENSATSFATTVVSDSRTPAQAAYDEVKNLVVADDQFVGWNKLFEAADDRLSKIFGDGFMATSDFLKSLTEEVPNAIGDLYENHIQKIVGSVARVRKWILFRGFRRSTIE